MLFHVILGKNYLKWVLVAIIKVCYGIQNDWYLWRVKVCELHNNWSVEISPQKMKKLHHEMMMFYSIKPITANPCLLQCNILCTEVSHGLIQELHQG